jgi:hypothetical protein
MKDIREEAIPYILRPQGVEKIFRQGTPANAWESRNDIIAGFIQFCKVSNYLDIDFIII